MPIQFCTRTLAILPSEVKLLRWMECQLVEYFRSRTYIQAPLSRVKSSVLRTTFLCRKIIWQRVKIFVDNLGASRILMIGSPKPHLQELAVDILNLCLRFRICIESQWLPREENDRADLLSRFVDRDGWSLNSSVFDMLDSRWGPHTIDRFSPHHNNQVKKFNSRFFSPGCAGVDALAQGWGFDNNWLCPPVHLIASSIRHLRNHKGVGTIVVPEWPSASFWPLLHDTPSKFAPFIVFIRDVVVLPRIANLLVEGLGQKAYYSCRPSVFSGCPSFNMLALRLVFA